MKPPLVLLDANIIIEVHELNVWQPLITSFDVAVPSVVARQEAKYFVVRGQHNSIKLSPYIAQGKITDPTRHNVIRT